MNTLVGDGCIEDLVGDELVIIIANGYELRTSGYITSVDFDIEQPALNDLER